MTDWLDEVRSAASVALPAIEGELTVPGLAAPCEVRRDAWGIPYVDAASLDDLWFAQGFVTASERLFQIDLVLRAANGRLSELFSEPTLEQDRFARVVGFHRIGAAEAGRWSDESRAMTTRFVEGVHAWIAAMPAPPVEYALLALAPVLPPPDDLGPWAAGIALAAWGLSGNWDLELLRSHLADRLGPEAVGTLLGPMPDAPAGTVSGALAGRLLDVIPRARGQGSNAWVVAGARTSSGKPILANDPHLLVQQPGTWFEVHLRAPGYEARGVAFPFSPGVLVGITPHHAWGVTNVTGDVQDLFEERLDEERTAAEYEGAWEPLTRHDEEILVRGGEPVALEVLESRHGPLLESATIGLAPVSYEALERSYALRWTATDGLIEPAALVGVVDAHDFASFREALRGISCPGQNVVYADVDGTIGYQLTGRYPVRRSGDGTVPVPGWSEAHEWDGWVAFEELPWSQDPERGFLVTANHRPHDETYPHLIGLDFHAPFRARRIADRLDELAGGTSGEHAALQIDTVSLAGRALVPRLVRIEGTTEDERRALEELRGWDGELAPDSLAAAIYNAWVAEVGRTLLADHPETRDRYLTWREPFVCAALPAILDGEIPRWSSVRDVDALLRRSLASSLAWLEERLGKDRSTWRWGALHRVRFAHPLARLPGLEPVFVAAEVELGGDEQTVLQAGFDAREGFDPVVVPSYRVVVDLADVDASRAVVPTGQSGHPASPSWNDQSRLWAEGALRPAPVTRPAVEASATQVLHLVPG